MQLLRDNLTLWTSDMQVSFHLFSISIYIGVCGEYWIFDINNVNRMMELMRSKKLLKMLPKLRGSSRKVACLITVVFHFSFSFYLERLLGIPLLNWTTNFFYSTRNCILDLRIWVYWFWFLCISIVILLELRHLIAVRVTVLMLFFQE